MNIDRQLRTLRDLPVGTPDARHIRSRWRRRRQRRLVAATAALIVVLTVGVAVAQLDDPVDVRTADLDIAEQPTTSEPPCGRVDLRVPPPALDTSAGLAQLDLLWLAHASCGLNADSSINLGGGEPKIIVVTEPLRLVVDDRFDVRYTLEDSLRPGTGLTAGRREGDGVVELEPLAHRCTLLTVDLAEGDLTARFQARLASAAGDCGEPATPTTPPVDPPTPTTQPVAPADEAVAAAVVAFARQPSDEAFAAIPLASRVWLGAGPDLIVETDRARLADPGSWVIDIDGRWARIGTTSAIELLANQQPTTTAVGPHPHCASPPTPAPAELADHRRVSILPTDSGSCLDWYAVDLFLDAEGEIDAVTIELFEP